MDRSALIGCWGALATVSGKISEWVGHHVRIVQHHQPHHQDRGGTQEEMIYRNYGKLDDQGLQDGNAPSLFS